MDTNELIRRAKLLGFIYHGKNGGNHLLFMDDNGNKITAAATPSDWRAHKNALMQMERVSGVKLDRKKTGRSIHKDHKEKFIDTPTTEPDSQLDSRLQVDSLRDEYNRLILEFRIIASADVDHTDINRAFKIVRRLVTLEEVLTELRQPVPEPSLKDLPTHIMTTKESA